MPAASRFIQKVRNLANDNDGIVLLQPVDRKIVLQLTYVPLHVTGISDVAHYVVWVFQSHLYCNSYTYCTVKGSG